MSTAAARQRRFGGVALKEEGVGHDIELGPEFTASDEVRPLTISEAKIIIDTNFSKRTEDQLSGKNE